MHPFYRSLLLTLLASLPGLLSAQPVVSYASGGLNQNAGLAVGGDGRVYLVTPSGTTAYTEDLALIWTASQLKGTAVAVDASNAVVAGGVGQLSRRSSTGSTWDVVLGGSGSATVTDVAVAPSGDIYAVGTVTGAVDFDPRAGDQSVTLAEGGFIAGYTSAGQLLSLAGVAPATATYPGPSVALAIHSDGTRYVAGAALTAFSANGVQRWSFNLPGTRALAVHADGRVTVGGFLAQPTDMDPGPGVSMLEGGSYFTGYAATYTPSGALAEVIGLSAGTNPRGSEAMVRDVSVGAHDEICLTGYFYNSPAFNEAIDFDPGPGVMTLPYLGAEEIFVACYQQRTLTWARRYGSIRGDVGTGVGFGAKERLFVAARIAESAELGGRMSPTPTLGGVLFAINAQTGTAAESAPAAASAMLRVEGAHPVDAELRLGFTLAQPQQVRVVLVDLLGREVQRSAVHALDAGTQSIRFDTARLTDGVYVVRVEGDGWAHSQRVVVCH